MATEDQTFVDSVLEEQLDDSSPRQASIGAVFTLRGAAPNHLLSAAETESLARQVVERASRATESQPERLLVYANLQSFAVQGPRGLLRELVRQPEIDTAVANTQSENLKIEPVSRREVPLASGPRALRRRGGSRGRSK